MSPEEQLLELIEEHWDYHNVPEAQRDRQFAEISELVECLRPN
jgi:hypothetical protein